MIDKNEQLKELFSQYELIDESELNDDYWIDRENPIYWIAVEHNDSLTCGMVSNMLQVKFILRYRPKKILFFKKRED